MLIYIEKVYFLRRIKLVIYQTKKKENTELKLKEEDNTKKIASPYTKQAKKYNKWVYVAIYVFILLLVLVAIIWSVKQVTINRNVTDTISYGK